MAKRVLICLSHSIEEYDQLRLLHELGYEVVSIGGYIDPAHPHDDKRPALPEVPCVAAVKDSVDALGTDDNLGTAQARVPEAVLDWLGADGVIVFHHRLERLFGQWEHLREWRTAGGRVIWRTVGQSVESNERAAQPFRAEGLEVVRYSSKERNIPGYAGEDALIRFYKDPEEWRDWTGEVEVVTNVTQELLKRDPWTNYGFWEAATRGLPRYPAGPGSENIEGAGAVTYEEMRTRVLREARCYLYTGTQPASYTLGLIEALVTGTPVVSIGPRYMQLFPYGSDLFEGSELAVLSADDPLVAHNQLNGLLADYSIAAHVSQHQRFRAVKTFGKDVVGAAWREYLGAP